MSVLQSAHLLSTQEACALQARRLMSVASASLQTVPRHGGDRCDVGRRHVIRCLGGAAAAAAIPLTHIEHPADGLQRYQPSIPEQPPISGDSVACYDELSAASGCLGRFPGSQVMFLIQQFLGHDNVGEHPECSMW